MGRQAYFRISQTKVEQKKRKKLFVEQSIKACVELIVGQNKFFTCMLE